jgi:signal transduction histidine kinase
MMFRSLQSRLWLTYALLVIGALGIVAVGLIGYLLSSPAIRAAQRAEEIADSIQQRGDLLENRAPERLAIAVQRADRLTSTRVIILAPDGTILADSRNAQGSPMPKLPLRSPLPSDAIRFRDKTGQVWFYALRELDSGNILAIGAPRTRLQSAQLLSREFIPTLIQAGALALLLAMLLSLWITRWVVSPLQHISKAARAVAAGSYQTIPLEGPSEVRELAATFNEMSERVQLSQKSQRDFVANVSHELKTPLTSIQGFAQAILDGTAQAPHQLQQAANVIYTEASRMHRLVIELLDLARLDSGIAELKRQPVDLGKLLESIAAQFIPQAKERQVELSTNIQAITPIIGDEDRLHQVFTNLVDNAIKNTPPRGQVCLHLALVNGQVEISVSNTGSGIPAEEIPRIFERFYQLDKSRKGGTGHGIGLGLSIAWEIVHAHHGTLAVQNNPGSGVTFTVQLPPSI